jgi:hypothetical protein
MPVDGKSPHAGATSYRFVFRRMASGLGPLLQCMKSSPLATGHNMSLRPNLKASLAFSALAVWALLSVLPIDKAWALYPDRIIKIVVPFAPGGGTDVIARTLAQEMAGNLGVNVVIENKPGAGTIIGTQAVAVSEPDGYTLLMGTFSHAVNARASST